MEIGGVGKKALSVVNTINNLEVAEAIAKYRIIVLETVSCTVPCNSCKSTD